ncbi:MAG: TIGR02556 family CRISPR-associated protein, partial [Dysgonamonadaceae bacterium]|nr:TIGR02556 family CRISPR-associated protein [Dysgonamonadaceae bacterium]MDD3901674.1 TIGR02556 family CRISPR-associated protein [Dysgonamonadaceae bacterium]MDD4400087.1 TIGR02556 family CRISPR-associated protein [Dysgonamonadaceae bacterium]
DRSISAIGHWQLEQKCDLDPVDLYIENMFPGKDYQMLLLVFDVVDGSDGIQCTYRGIDIEKIKKESASYRKYAYRKGSPRGGDVTITTKLSNPPDKKLQNIKNAQFGKLTSLNHAECQLFKLIESEFVQNEDLIASDVKNYFDNASKEEQTTTGISLRIHRDRDLYLNDFELIRDVLLDSGSEKKYDHNGTKSRTTKAVCSVTGKVADEIYGFAAPFKYSSPDKPGFISGFFHKERFWRNYPVSSKEALALEYGKKYIKQHLTGYFYGHEFLFVPKPILQSSREDLAMIVELLKDAFATAREKRLSKEERSNSEEYVQKIIAEQGNNYFYVDMLFYSEDKKTEAISIEMMLEEILPSRFNQLFIQVPEKVGRNPIFKDAIVANKESKDLKFTYRIISDFFEDKFLDVVQSIFLGRPISKDFLFERITNVIRKNYNEQQISDKWTKPTMWSVLEAIMLISYLQELEIMPNHKNSNYMNTVENESKSSRFNLEGFNMFLRNNGNFLDSDIKIGIFAIGVLVRFLFDIQYRNLKNTPFENKLRGYKLNPEILMQVYTEALDKIQKYQKTFYVYSDLREIIAQYFVLHKDEMASMSNNELSFYFVAGLELGRKFKNERDNENETE